jgi:hypothetical protein
VNKILLIVVCIGVFSCCNSCSSSRKVKAEQIHSLLQEKLGSSLTQEKNSSGNFILYKQDQPETNIKIALKFVVVNIAENTIIYEGSFLPGYVKWHSDSELEILSVPGTIQADEDLSHYKKIIRIASPKQ